MIELSYEQVQALLGFMQSTKSFLSTVDGVDHVVARRDSLIDDAEQWSGMLLRKQLDSPVRRT